ncbi:MAG TPA: GreA/GreB family elongation factor [Candidatus Eisenbacteria bacterium]|jgi:transcription elongation factor GreA
MPIREQLPPVLRGEIAADLTPESRAHLEALAHEAEGDGMLAFARDECAARLKQPNPAPGVEYLLAATCALNGEIERAHQTLLVLGEKLAAGARWEPLAAVAERALALETSAAAVRLLVRAHDGLGDVSARLEALRRAWSLLPEDLDLALALAVRLGEAGEGEERRALLADLLPRFAAESRYAGLEEAALEFAEHGDTVGLLRLIETLPDVAAQGALAECEQLLAIAFPPVAAAGVAGPIHAALRAVVARAAEKEGPAASGPFRGALLEALKQGQARELPDPAGVLAASGIEDRMKPLPQALERFDAIAALPPGRAVMHDAFGAGRIASDDGEEVRIDFATRKGHRMPYAAARRTLTPIAEDDLRLLRSSDPAALARLRAEEPGSILVRALRSLGGSADAQRFKVFLVGSDLVPAAEWNAFWRRARAEAVKDPRIDASRAFEQQFRLAAPGDPERAENDAPLPGLEPRKSAKSNLTTLRKFLLQHPGSEVALARRFGRSVERWLLDPEGERADRARAGAYFARWFPERAAAASTVLMELWEQGLAIGDLSGEDEQLALLEASHALGVAGDAILSALDSRFTTVREAAERLRTRLDEAGRAELRRTMLQHAPRYPGAALRAVEEELSRTPGPADGWQVLWSALALIEDRPKASVAEKVVGWLEPGQAFDRMLEGTPPPEDVRLRIRVMLRQWRSSDRFLFPALEALARLGMSDEVESLREARLERTEKLFDRVGQPAEDAGLSVMTRATWELLSRELERLERELRTTIPAAIQKARELGDLRENAEYHSAKLKQSNVSKLVRSLQLRLARARFVDDAEYKDGVVGLGTEVTLESEDEVATWWILGEGEHHHGDRVVSFQAPVGRALVGRSIGDEVELGEGESRRRYRVVSVERKLPPAESPTREATA